MEGQTPISSQENVLSSGAASVDGDKLASSPVLPPPRGQQSSKPRKAPTITPRSFTRFFTPKSSLERGGRIGASRQALRDITASASNRKGRRASTKNIVQIYEEDRKEKAGRSKSNKRKIPDTPERSSPLKRIRNQSLEIAEDGSDTESAGFEEVLEEHLQRLGKSNRKIYKIVEPIGESRYRGPLGRSFRREIGAYGVITKAWSSSQRFAGSKHWQCETTDFFTRPEDTHVCMNVGASSDQTIPFCTASCNSESCINFISPSMLLTLQ